MWIPYGQVPPLPDFEKMKKSWKRASSSQKVVRVGLVGALVAGITAALVDGGSLRPSPPAQDREKRR